MTTFSLQNINQIVAVGSIDGVLATAAMLRLIGNKEIPIIWTQAFQVDKIDLSTWDPNRQVAFVDLAVNNRDKQMTADFVRQIREAGHTIVAICDEHNRDDWEKAYGPLSELLVPRCGSLLSQG